MAPSRRRCAGKAAAAAAARRQWKVGDLVLAKLKGFPAWPATVSEPEKWGYQSDVRKVLVYFFGTQQIALCNPVDVEAFTEEKKQSLLTKRQGKGADFVRAVQEIVDIYEKSKEQGQFDELNSGHEVTLALGNSAVSSPHSELKDQTETSESTPTGGNDHPIPVDVTQDMAQTEFLHEKEALSEQHTDNVMAPDKPIIATYSSRRRSSGFRSRKNIVENIVSSVERSGSSCRLESPIFQNSMMPANDPKESAGHVSYNIIWEKSLQRNQRLMKLPEKSKGDDEDSSGFVSNCSIEDNGSEIATVDSDSFSLKDGNTVDSGCRPEQSETFVKCLEGDVQLSKELDFQIQAVVIRKKRIRNTICVSSGVAEPTVGLETEGDLEVALSNSSQNPQSACENVKVRSNQEDGDRHLPLVKRARVRMGKSFVLDEELVNSSHAEEKHSNEIAVSSIMEHNNLLQAGERTTSHEALVDRPELVGPSVNPADDGSAPGDSLVMQGAIHDSSPLKVPLQIRGNRPQLLCVKVTQSLGGSADEAALPPSKRLHRALEAMSANAAEEAEAGAEISTMKTSIRGCSLFVGSSIQGGINCKESNSLADQNADNLGNRVSTFGSYSNIISEEAGKSLLEAEKPRECTGGKEPQEDVFPAAKGLDDSKGQVGLCHATDVTTDIQARCSAHFIPDVNEGMVNQLSDHELLDKDGGIYENSKARNLVAENLDKELGAGKQCGSTPSVNGPAKVAFQNCTRGDLCSTENNGYENTKSFSYQIGDNCQISGGSALGNDVKLDEKKNKSSHVSFLDNILVDKHVVDILPNTFHADGADSPARMSPSITSICHASTSESANIIQSTCCFSANVSSNKQNAVCSLDADEEKCESAVPQRPKSVDKRSNDTEAFAALSLFEGMLGSLTRTKDSIGRATRLAIDCAKHGLSAKVVEILSRTLENESNLHRRVDFFFLVDSIAQCSRSLKGNGGVYPSVIQLVLPRLLSAAAPPGSYSHENRRQCLKVLRLWRERRILPESVICHHIRELDLLGCSSSAGPYSRRSARTERAFDDPVRDMEGMLVDEYGSNSSFQLPGFCMPCILKDEDDDSDGGSFEAVTPEHISEIPNERQTGVAMGKHIHILEDVDGELEMEDLAPSCEAEMSSTGGANRVNAAQNMHGQFEQQFPVPAPLPHNIPPSSLPFPSSPTPLLPPPPPTALCSGVMSDPYANGVDSNGYTNSQNVQNDLMQSVAPRMNPSMSSSVCLYAPEFSNNMQIRDSTSSCSRHPVRQVNDIQHDDSPTYHHDPYPPRPAHIPSSDQFSYFRANQNMKSRRETQSTSYSHRFSSSHDFRGGRNYDRRERMRPPASDYCEDWRFYAPPFHGPRNSYKSKGSYAPAPYGGPLREPNRLRRQNWECHSRGTNHRNFMPFRTSSGGAISVASRASNYWRP